MHVDGRQAPGAFLDFGLYLFHNHGALEARGTGPYFYLPKLESHLEARLWADIFRHSEARLGLAPQSIKVTAAQSRGDGDAERVGGDRTPQGAGALRRALPRGVRSRPTAIPDPLPGRPDAPAAVGEAYARLSRAIAEFECSRVFNRFTSKYDYYLAGRTTLSARERRGLEVFEGEGKCADCHPSQPGVAADGRRLAPLFTDFTYDNLGVPRNVNIPGNPAPDAGLGARADVAARDPAGAELGKHKVVTLRNIAVTPPYSHNGVFPTLAEIVRFYNTRDTLKRVCADNNDPGFGRDCWPRPEVAANVNTEELGNLGLSAEDEAALVAFMQTLTDGYPDWGQDPNVPPNTPSPFLHMPVPPLP